jgi:hypothetical protein
MKIVVCALGGAVGPWDLPASRLVERTWIHGGERSLYELAVAAAAIGQDVELRGDISEPDLRDLRDAAGAAPAVGMGPRRPTEEENAWDLFMKRVDEALSELPPPDRSREARATIGDELAALIRRGEEERDRARVAAQEAERAFQALRGRRSVRWALRMAQVARPWFALKERRRRS